MGIPLTNNQTFDALSCGECGAVFYVDSHWLAERRATGGSFSCPNGHPRVFKESEVTRLQRELAQKTSALEFERKRAARLEKSERRLKRRIAVGVCPCCQRTVSQLARHMKTKHPDYVAQAGRP